MCEKKEREVEFASDFEQALGDLPKEGKTVRELIMQKRGAGCSVAIAGDCLGLPRAAL